MVDGCELFVLVCKCLAYARLCEGPMGNRELRNWVKCWTALWMWIRSVSSLSLLLNRELAKWANMTKMPSFSVSSYAFVICIKWNSVDIKEHKYYILLNLYYLVLFVRSQGKLLTTYKEGKRKRIYEYLATDFLYNLHVYSIFHIIKFISKNVSSFNQINSNLPSSRCVLFTWP